MEKVLLLLVVLLAAAPANRAASYCSTLQRGPSLYERVCCQVGNLGKEIRLEENGLVVIHCPSVRPRSCRGQPVPMHMADCKSWYESGNTTSGNYTIYPDGQNPSEVYCDMEGTQCDGRGGWTRVGYLNMTQSGATCPIGLTLLNFNNLDHSVCGKPNPSDEGCDSTNFSSHGINYTEVCGQLRGYQFGSPNAFPRLRFGIDSNYLDGVSITHGRDPRQHIWSYVGGVTEQRKDYSCPCNTGFSDSNRDPRNYSFIGDHYYCESGLHPNEMVTPTLHVEDPLWDGKDCHSREIPCCVNSTMPWFYRSLDQYTQDDIELRLCNNQGVPDEDTPLDIIELYIK